MRLHRTKERPMPISRRNAAKAMLAAGGGWAASALAKAAPADKNAPEERLRTQVCVIGGGSGGIGAALAAARGGAQTVLLEREAILGGTMTLAWVHSWEPVSGADGLPRDLYAVMKRDPLGVSEPDYAKGAPRGTGQGLPFEPRALVVAANALLEAAGRCTVLVGTTFVHARVDGDRIRAIEAYFPGRHLVVEADVFIDCTADGDVCAEAGCDFHLGEDPKSRYNEPSAPASAEAWLNSCSLVYRITDTGVRQKPYLPAGVPEGLCPRPVHIVVLPNGDHLLNPVRMIEGNAVLEGDYARLMHEGHRRVLEHFHWLQTLDPSEGGRWTRFVRDTGYGTWTICGIAPRIGVRESRRILGDYVLTEHDCRAGVRGQTHTDVVTISDHAVDLHGRKGRHWEMPNGPYGVPYRCLLPRGVGNLMIASRAASFSHIAASSCRLSRTVMTLGQAAGTAAAMSVQRGVPPRGVDVAELQAALKAQGVALSPGQASPHDP